MSRRRTSSILGVVAAGVFAFAACSSDEDTLVSGTEPSAADEQPVAADDSVAEASTVTEAGAAGCPPEDGAAEQTQQFDGPPPMCLDPAATYSAVVSTSAGDVTIALDQAAAPNTVNSFVFLARNNYFDDTVCHRIIQEFVVQCGDPTASGTGGPGYEFADELPTAGAYTVGSLAMANAGPNTNGSQFFIITGDAGASLPPLYSRFGQVDEPDLGVVEAMNQLGSLDSGGVPSQELRILDVTITQS